MIGILIKKMTDEIKESTLLMTEKWFAKAWDVCKTWQEKALAPITGTKVGACVYGIDKDGFDEFIGGCNLEISISNVYHAEETALISLVKKGIKPVVICCTSKSDEEHIAMCGSCRQLSLDINSEMRFVIFNPNGKIKFMGLVKDFMKDNKSWGKIVWND